VAVGDNDARHVVTEGLEGKIIIVSGASSGIGAATAKELASSGAQVVVADIDEKGAADTAQAIRDAGGSAISTAVDVRDDASVRKMIDVTIEHFGRIDGLHNNVADIALVVKDTTILDMETWVWERTLQTNLTGIFHIMRHALPHMLKVGGGAIVNTSSASAFSAKPVNPGYASSKAALNALTRHVASAYGRQGIRCNAIAPGAVRTEGAVAAATAMGHDVEAFYKNLRENIAHSHRDGTPEDIAAIVALLLSDRGSWINGQCISVDGGWLFR
jgi:NAD(P)-dependent dehydrogenase (short-subunit alcohol dehydrogenase family)